MSRKSRLTTDFRALEGRVAYPSSACRAKTCKAAPKQFPVKISDFIIYRIIFIAESYLTRHR